MNLINIENIKNVISIRIIQKTFVCLLMVALASQVNLELFESDFVVSAGVILFVMFLYYYEEINPIIFGGLSGLAIFGLRLIVFEVFDDLSVEVAYSYMPEMVFYVVYSLFFILFLENDRKDNLGFVYIVFIICDFSSNFIEVFVRYTVLGELTLLKTIPTLIIVSFVRSSIVWVVLTGVNYYNILLTKKEHEERYQKLLLLTSQLETELYLLNKNIENIGKVRNQCDEFLKKIRNDQDRDSWMHMMSAINTKVDEVKKGNELIVKGIKNVAENELKDRGMEYKDINNVLLGLMRRESKNCNKNIEFEFIMGENFYTPKHYYLISVLSNLIKNSIDSIRKAQEDAKISVVHQVNEEEHVFIIKDNGAGIEEVYLDQIFLPGFTTKVSKDTGEVKRGVGLSIVKYIVEEYLEGQVEVNSKPGIGTTFIISIPKIFLEGNVVKSV